MWQRFTKKAREVFFRAQEEATRVGSDDVTSEHILLAILTEPDTVAARLLSRLGLDFDALESAIRAAVPVGAGRTTEDMHLTQGAHRSIDYAYFESKDLGDAYIGTEHLLLGLIHEKSSSAAQALASVGITLETARSALSALRESEPVTGDGTWRMFSDRARRAMFFAQEEAVKLDHRLVATEHLLLGMLRDDDTFAESALRRFGVSRDAIRAAVNDLARHGEGADASVDLRLAPDLKRAIDLAWEEALALNRHYVGTDFLLIGLVREEESVAGRVLRKLGVTAEAARKVADEVWSAGVPQSPPPDAAG